MDRGAPPEGSGGAPLPPSLLPPATPEAEEAFVARWRDQGGDPDLLAEVLQEAVGARRVRLAARLAQLLPEEADLVEPELLARLKRAAGLVLHQRLRPEDVSWSELEEAWSVLRAQRMRRIRERMRNALDPRPDRPRLGRLGRDRRR